MNILNDKALFWKIVGTSMVFLLLVIAGSGTKIDTVEPVQIEDENESAKPIYFDFEEIKKRGTLRMITRYSPATYFLLDGMDRGFEFELVTRFARENKLKVEVVMIGPEQDPVQALDRGEGDLIADHIAITEELMEKVSFSKPYNFINQGYDASGIEVENVSLSGPADTETEKREYKTTARYVGEREPGMMVSERETIAWATRKNASELKQKMDEFIDKHIRVRESDGRILRSAYLNNLRQRYFEKDRFESRYNDRAYDAIQSGYLTPYDEMAKSIAQEAGVDWKLVIAVMAQESAFDPKAESIAGALGLMQIIPRFSKVKDETELYDPETNIREGVRYLQKHLIREAHLDSLNQHAIALAAYNVGMGNLADARKLAVQLGKDPNEWPNIADALLKLMHREYYQHARYGYKRGSETVNYVEDVLNRYSRYQAIYKMVSHSKKVEDEREELIVLGR